MFCALSGRSLSWNTPVFSRLTSRKHANFIGCHFFHTHGLPLHSNAQPLKNCGKRSFLGVAKSWKVTLDLVPWFWNHVENLGDVIIYPVLVVARTGSRLLSSASGHGTVAKRTVGKGRDFFLLPIFPRAILPRTFSFVTCWYLVAWWRFWATEVNLLRLLQIYIAKCLESKEKLFSEKFGKENTT